jgi:hypothetical protein
MYYEHILQKQNIKANEVSIVTHFHEKYEKNEKNEQNT